MNDITIREGKPEDKSEIIKCFEYLQTYEKEILPIRREANEMSEKYYSDILEPNCFGEIGKIELVEHEDKIAGFVAYWIKGEKGDRLNYPEEILYISDLVIMPEYQKQGFAFKLLENAQNFAKSKNVRKLKIGVLAKNIAASNLYSKFGFEPESIELTKDI